MTNGTEEDAGQLYMLILGSYIVPILFSIIVVVGFIGNIMVIFVILANRQMQNTTNILIISLALADLLFIVFCVPFTAVIYANGSSWPLGTPLCKIYQYTIFTTAYCSVYTLVLMSVDRYLAVVHPIRSMTLRNEKNTIYAVLATWLLFLFLNLPLLYVSGVVNESSNMPFCAIKTLVSINDTTGSVLQNKQMGQVYFGLFFLFGYILPVIVICILYGLLINRLLFGQSSTITHSSEAVRSKRRVTRMVVIVISIFSICWLPIQIVFMFQFFGPGSDSYFFITIHVLSNCLAYANSMVNPILYAFLSENFQKAFLNVICYFKQNNQAATIDGRTTIACQKLSVLQHREATGNFIDKQEDIEINEDANLELQPLGTTLNDNNIG